MGIQEPSNQHPLSYKRLYRLMVIGSHWTQKKRLAAYLSLVMGILVLTWFPIVLMLYLLPTTYTSDWTLILPGAGNGHAVSLESIGQASANTASPYSNSSVDPLVNYKAIALSKPVLSAAADKMAMPLNVFGKPKIKLVDQTTLMQFEVKGSSADEANQKSHALYQALQQQLDILRDNEWRALTGASLSTISDFNEKLELAQQQKLDYQIKSGIVSLDQFKLLVQELEERRIDYEALQVRHQALNAQIAVFKNGLNLQEAQLPLAIALRNDPIFQEHLTRHAEIHSQIATIEGVWGENHPQLNQLLAAHSTVDHELTFRGHFITGDPKLSTRQLIDLGSNTLEGNTLLELLSLIAEKRGVEQQLLTEAEFILQRQHRIENSVTDTLRLEDLGRKQQVATAVFSTALAKQDIGKSDRFSSYPLVQILAEPTLPDEPDMLVMQLAIAGGIAASLLTLLGILLLWTRKPLLQKIRKSDSSGMV